MITRPACLLVTIAILIPCARNASSEDAKHGEVTLQVVDEKNRPVEITKVQLWVKTETGGRGFTFAASPTGRVGVYRVYGIPVGTYRGLKINKPGYAPYWQRDIAINREKREIILCKLSRGGRIEGLVTDDTGKLLGGIRVTVNSVLCRRDVVTDENGRFVADHLSPDIHYSIIAEPPRDSVYETAVLSGGASPGAKDLQIRLRKKQESKKQREGLEKEIRLKSTSRPSGSQVRVVEQASVQSMKSARRQLLGNRAPPLVIERWLGIGADFWQLQFNDKVVVVEFWGVWCAPCRRAIPLLRDLFREHASKGLVIVGVHTSEQKEQVPEFLSTNRVPYPVGVDHNDKTAELYCVSGYPTTVVIDRKGIVRAVDPDHSDIERLVSSLLREQESRPDTAPNR